jgi:hypothetical protein
MPDGAVLGDQRVARRLARKVTLGDALLVGMLASTGVSAWLLDPAIEVLVAAVAVKEGH